MADDLIERARSGEADAWRELYEALTGRLLVWLRTRPSGDVVASAEDLAAESWLVAARSIGDFEGDRDAFAGWLFGIARHQALNARRRALRRSTQAMPTSDDASVWGAYDGPADGVAGADWTRWALAQLPPRESEVLASMEVAGLDAAQTASALGMSVTAVRVARHRGLARLRKLPTDAARAAT